MSKDLWVQMAIPIRGHVEFHKWLPLESGDFIVVNDGDMTLTFWFAKDCWFTVKDWDLADLPNIVNVKVSTIFADVSIKDVSDDLADFIVHTDYYRRASDSYTQEEKRLMQQYEQLGERVHVLTLGRLNRLLSFVRSEKGQYWLEEYPVDPGQRADQFTRFNAQVKSEDSEWNRWVPTITTTIRGAQLPDETRLIDRDDWSRIRKFVVASGDPDLVGELLARAELLAKSGHRRSALTEAVTALEVAISRFSQNPDAGSEFGSHFAERLNLSSLKGQVGRLGLTGTLRYLFPLIFPEDQLPTEILRPCQEAIGQRQNVVHQGQRDVDERKLNLFLHSIRQMCSILGEYSHG